MFRTDNTKFSRSPETWPSCEVTLRFFFTFHLLKKNEILSCMSDPCYNLTLNNTSGLFILRNQTDQNKSPKEQCTKCTQYVPIHVYNVIPIQVPPVILYYIYSER